ncbi:MAG: phage tail assembly chaperone [Allorhizobium sp.]
MRLADDEIIVSIGSETIRLGPTLRAALRLERQHDGFDKLVRDILDGHLSTIVGVIVETSTPPISTDMVHGALKDQPLRWHLAALTTAALGIVMQLIGLDQENAAQQPLNGPRMTFREFHTQLFRIATGNLGWTPDSAWNATPAEILEAHHGRVDLLRSIFGSADKPSASITEYDDQRDEAGIADLKAMGGKIV